MYKNQVNPDKLSKSGTLVKLEDKYIISAIYEMNFYLILRIALKFYVVRKGKKIGIFDSRDECKLSVNGFSDAKYKSFENEEDAKIALQEGWEKYYEIKKTSKKVEVKNEDIPFFADSIAVDAACSGNPGEMEYRGIDLKTGEEIFHEKFAIGTNNIGEFLAIVHGLEYLGDDNRSIYSDSKIAMSRVNQGKCKTKINIDEDFDSGRIFKAIEGAEKWLKENGIKHRILKRNTEDWGEIPADFGRK